MESTRLDPHASWQGRPLCCKYWLVHFVTQPIRVRGVTAAQGLPVTWALGALSDGQREVLGVWSHSVEGVPNWQPVFDDLAVRGVEQIRFAVHADAAFAQTTFPHLKALDTALPEWDDLKISAGQDAPRSMEICGAGNGQRCDLSALPRRVQQLVRRGEEAVRLLRRGVARAAARQGPFDSAQAAVAFADAWLVNAERRQRRGQFPASRGLGTAAAMAP